MENILKNIVLEKKNEVSHLKNKISLSSIEDILRSKPEPRNFLNSINKVHNHKFNIIAEIKRASPSKGIIRKNFDLNLIANAYEKAGASCLSILTDKKWFQGDNRYIAQAKSICSLPILRKDFIIDPIQVYESRLIEADCILLIMSILSDQQAHELEELALSLKMSVLIEAHNKEELNRAFKLSSPLVGINNRNLNTMEVSIKTSKNLLPMFPIEKIAVSESGIKNNIDLRELANEGAKCFLIGESLMKQKDIITATKNLIQK